MRYLFAVKITIVSILCATLIITPTSSVVAQTSTRAQQIEALSAALVIIGDAISTATDITQAQRVALYTQLVSLSNAIVALRMTEESSAITTDNTIAETGFQRAVLSYDYDEPTEVDATLYFASTSRQTDTFNYPALLEYNTFETRMSAVRQFGSYDISQKLGVAHDEASRLTHITGRNPGHREAVGLNSTAAYELLDGFGMYSIINQANIFPGDGAGKIELKSDQGETLTLEIATNVAQRDSSGPVSNNANYNYKYTFRNTDAAKINDDKKAKETDGYIIYETYTNVEREEILEELAALFEGQPLAEEINNYEEKIFNFMLENNSYLLADEKARYQPNDRNCYDKADVAVMTELLSSLMVTMGVQHEPVPAIFLFQAPVLLQDEGSGFHCRNVSKVF